MREIESRSAEIYPPSGGQTVHRRALASRAVSGLRIIEPDCVESHAVVMRDGVKLATDVYLPDAVRRGSLRRVPVLFSRLPYGRREQVACLPAIASEMTERGYAVVAQDIRGRYDSEGTARPFADHELGDAYATLDWINAQPWARNGVVMFGDSYCGWLQWAAAATGHPGLRAIVPAMTTTRIGDTWMYTSGTFSLRPMLEWAIVAWSARENRFEEPDWRTRPLAALIDIWLGDSPAGAPFKAWASSPQQASYWRRGTFSAVRPTRSRIPALHLGGWWDLFRRGQLSDWRTARRARPDQHLVMTASDHHHIPLRPEPWLSMQDEDDAQYARRFAAAVSPFLKYVFEDAPALPTVRYEIAHAGWLVSDNWPPRGLRRRSFSLVDGRSAVIDYHGGGLSPRPPRGRSRLVWRHDPNDLVPATERDPFAALVAVADQRVIEGRQDVPTFSSTPLTEPLDLVGESRLLLRGDGVMPHRQFIARLCDVFPDGRVFMITEGALTLPKDAAVGNAVLVLAPCAYRLQPHHCLRLEIAASSFPRYLASCAGDPWADFGESVEYELTIGGGVATRLDVCVLPSALSRLAQPMHCGG
jgi:putative CocE/NonD family hydrolase